MHKPSGSVIYCFSATLTLSGGCGEDEVASASVTESTGTGTGTGTGLTADPTEELPTGGEPGNDLQCFESEYPLSGSPFDVAGPKSFDLRPATSCNNLGLNTDMTDVVVYHPDPLPDTPLPVIVMTNGAGGQNVSYYDHVLRPLARLGFIVFAVQSAGEISDRSKMMACTLRYLRREWNVENQEMFPGDNPAKFSCDLVLMGASRGGGAAYGLGSTLEGVLGTYWYDINPIKFDMTLRSVVGIAPKFNLLELASYAPSESVPYLAMMGSVDEDPTHQAIPAYDNMILESQQTGNDPGKLLLWPYRVTHSAFGGLKPGFGELPDAPKGRAIAAGFIPPFLDLFVMGNETKFPIITGEELPFELSSAMGQWEAWWGGLDPSFIELGEVPVILRDFVVDQRNSTNVRHTLDNFENGGDFTSSLEVVVGPHTALAQSSPQVSHSSQVLKVKWGDSLLDGDVTWELNGGMGKDLSDFSFFSLRVGQELPALDLGTCKLLETDPRRDALVLKVRLEDSMSNVSELLLGPIIQQDSLAVTRNNQKLECVWSQFMQTLRLPLADFCEESGFDIESVVSLTIEFPELEFETAVFMDTLEFTRHPLDDANLCM